MNLSSSTVSTILSQKEKLKEVAESCVGGTKLEPIART
jgi:predicted transcriptional regulator